jgi:hypothetical protein
MNDYQKEIKEREDETQKKLEQIAQCLGFEWKLQVKQDGDGQHRSFSLIGPEDTQIVPRRDNGRLCLHVYGHYRGEYLGNHLPRNVEAPEITCAFDRAASDIAQDMRRRIIPGAIAYTREGREAVDRWWDGIEGEWAVLERIEEALGQKVNGRFGNIDKKRPADASVTLGTWGSPVYAKVKYTGYNGGHMEFEIHVEDNVELGLELCHWLKEVA